MPRCRLSWSPLIGCQEVCREVGEIKGAAEQNTSFAEILSSSPCAAPTAYSGCSRALVLSSSPGIDCMYCEHVVMFDFPRDPSEYVRRAGRTARGAGGRGTVSVLVLGRQVPLAKEIMAGNEKGQPIHKLPETE